jgi:hypothetical protein
MREIDNIIRAARAAYTEFAATGPDSEVRESVANAVRFLVADLTSASEFAGRALTESR